jgi:hypothetical protein
MAISPSVRDDWIELRKATTTGSSFGHPFAPVDQASVTRSLKEVVMARRIFLLVAALLVSPVTSWAQTTILMTQSQPGDYVGGGLNRTFTEADGTFTATRNFNNGVSIQFRDPNFTSFWMLDFAAAGGALLTPGLYEDAARFPFQGNQPGLSVSGEGRGCNQLTGRFEVLEVTFGSGSNVTSFAATFEQHCEGNAPALLGTILVNANAPVPPQLNITLIGCLHCHAGDHLIAQVTLRNPGATATPVEMKVGLRLPDGTGVSLFGPNGQHIVFSLPAGAESTFPVLNFTWPAGAPPGAWRVEGTLLEPSLGKTFSRDVRLFEIEP